MENFSIAVVTALFLGGSLWVYSGLLQAVFSARGGRVRADNFGRPDLVIASILVSWFGLSSLAGLVNEPAEVTSSAMLAGMIVFAAIIATIIWVLRFQNISVVTQFGLNPNRPGKLIFRGVGYLLAAYPLIAIAGVLGTYLAGADTDRQDLVEFFVTGADTQQRLLVIGTAVIVAPIAEEVIFRGYIYGVAKRYFGIGVGLVINGVLFTLVHQYLPGAGVYFILAACLTLAYEKSGSLLVPMAMHAVFNAVSLSVLMLTELNL